MNIQVRVLSIDRVREKEELLLSYISDERREKALGMLMEEKRLQEIGSAYFLKRYLPADLPLKYTRYHKPYMDGVFFNLSHSHSYVAFLLADKECGIDMEKIRKHKERLVHYAFSQKESENIHDDESFFSAWTRKEALSKANGLGLIGNDIRSVPSMEGKVFYQDGIYQVKSVRYQDYFISVALKAEEEIKNIGIIEEKIPM